MQTEAPFPLDFSRGRLLAWEPPPPGPRRPALLLMHGAACGAWIWAEGFATHLARAGHPAYALAFSRTGSPGLADYAADARAAIAALNRPVVLVGHSLGGLIAQRLLGEAAVRGAALLAPCPPEGLAWANWRLAMANPPLWRAVARMTEPPGSLPDRPDLRRALFSDALPDHLARRFMARLGGESRTALLEAQAPQPVPPAWSLGKPLLVLGARRDALVPPDTIVRTAAWHAAPFALLDGTGHMMMLDAGWEALAERLVAWVEEAIR